MGTVLLDGVGNARDLGGVPLPEGGSTVAGVVIRSATLDGLTAQGLEQLLALRPSRIIDLRSAHEKAEQSPIAGHEAFRQLPFVDPSRDGERDPATERSRSDLYRGSLHRNGNHVARIWTEIAEAEHGPVVIYCRSGVDRTGMLVALLLSVAGVDPEIIAEDYAVQPGSDPHLSATSGSPKDPRRPAWIGSPPDPQTMIDILDWMHTHYGGAVGYLSDHGVAATHIATVRQRLIQPPSATSQGGSNGGQGSVVSLGESARGAMGTIRSTSER